MKLLALATLLGLSSCASTPNAKPLNPSERARLHLEVALASLNEGDLTGTLQSVAAAEAYDPNIPELQLTKGIAYFGKHQPSLAIEFVKKAVSLNPTLSDANNTLGYFLLSQGRYDEAVAPLLKAARDPLYRDSYKSWTNLGVIKFQLGLYSESRNFFDHAIVDAPERACTAYYYRGQLGVQTSNLDAAIQDFQNGTKKFCARSPDTQLALALAHQKKKEYNSARRIYIEVHDRYPNTRFADEAMDQLRNLPGS